MVAVNRKRLWVVVVLGVSALVACGDARSIGDVMVDAGRILSDANTADAQDTEPPSGGVPIGTVLAFAGPEAPEGWLACDGAEVDRDDYAALFEVLGTAHGSGDGASSFHLPDYRGRFLRGADRGAGRDAEADAREAPNDGGNVGDRVGSVQSSATAMPRAPFALTEAGDHEHTYVERRPIRLTHDGSGATIYYSSEPTGDVPTSAAGAHSHAITGGDHETRPENAAVLFIIRAQ